MCFKLNAEDDFHEEPVRIMPYRRRHLSSTIITLPLPEEPLLRSLVQSPNYFPSPRELDYNELARQQEFELLRQQELATLQALALEEERAELLAQEDALRRDATILQALALEVENARLQDVADEIMLREAAQLPVAPYVQGRRPRLPPPAIYQDQITNSPILISPPIVPVNGSSSHLVVVQQNKNLPQQQLILAPILRSGRSRSGSRQTIVYNNNTQIVGRRDQINYNNTYVTNAQYFANNRFFYQHQQQQGSPPISTKKKETKLKTKTKNGGKNSYYPQRSISDSQIYVPRHVPTHPPLQVNAPVQVNAQPAPPPTSSDESQQLKLMPRISQSGSPVLPSRPTTSNTHYGLPALPPPHMSTSSKKPLVEKHLASVPPSDSSIANGTQSVQLKSNTSTLLPPPLTRPTPPISTQPQRLKSPLSIQPTRSRSPPGIAKLRSPLFSPPTKSGLQEQLQRTKSTSPIQPAHSSLQRPYRSYSPQPIHAISKEQSIRQPPPLSLQWKHQPPILSGSSKRQLGSNPLLPVGILQHQRSEKQQGLRAHRDSCIHHEPDSWCIENKHGIPADLQAIQASCERILLCDSTARNKYVHMSSTSGDDNRMWYGYTDRKHPNGSRKYLLHKKELVSEMFDRMCRVCHAIEVLQQNQLCCERLTILVQDGTDPITVFTISISDIMQLMKDLEGISDMQTDSSRAYTTDLDRCMLTIRDMVSKIPPIRRAFEIEEMSNEPLPFSEEFLLHRCSLVVQILGVMVVANSQARIAKEGSANMLLPNVKLEGSNYHANDKLIGIFRGEGLRSMAAVTRTHIPVLRLASSNSRASQLLGISGRLCASIEDIVDAWGGLEDINLDGSNGSRDCARSVAISGGHIVQVGTDNWSDKPLYQWISGSLPSQYPYHSFNFRKRILID